jgi:hypothetical protein
MNALPEDSPRPSLAGRLLRRLPGGRFAQQQIDTLERRVLQELKARLDRVAPQPAVSLLAVSLPAAPAPAASAGLGNRMQSLLTAALEQTREQAELAFFEGTLAQLAPDQARILAALSDGTRYPLLHVYGGARFGLAMEPVLECVSNVGKAAGVLFPDATRVHVLHLRALGLVSIGAEEPQHKLAGELLETEPEVRDALAQLQRGGYRVQVLRRSLALSALGARLWALTRVGEDLAP